jgi:hypothetical protein
MRSRGVGARAVGLAGAVVLALGIGSVALAADPFGQTTVQQRILPDGAAGFNQLTLGPGEGYVVRDGGFGSPQKGRAGRRTALAYFGQLSDFQLADEESPARVEFLDPAGAPVEAAFRPWEALEPFIDEATIRQVDAFAGAGPVAAGDRSRPKMDFAIDTGDSADSQQLNETEWVRTLLEGGSLDPNSGIDRAATRTRSARRSASRAPPRPPATPESRTTTTTSRGPTRTSTIRTTRAAPPPAGPPIRA